MIYEQTYKARRRLEYELILIFDSVLLALGVEWIDVIQKIGFVSIRDIDQNDFADDNIHHAAESSLKRMLSSDFHAYKKLMRLFYMTISERLEKGSD